jgi:F0F1-type ATP synthase membrane subunit a
MILLSLGVIYRMKTYTLIEQDKYLSVESMCGTIRRTLKEEIGKYRKNYTR